jgi:phosphoribosylaminoimidazolecarboxamide formyltransferase / IMP cyclohydrolase
VIQVITPSLVGGQVQDIQIRQQLAAKVFGHLARYDSLIAYRLSEGESHVWPQYSTPLKYGENPHQKAFLLSHAEGVGPFDNLSTAEISYNNYLDADAAWSLCCEFDEPTVAIIKHTNPCGLASAKSIGDAFDRAFACDPQSAFGGVIATNRVIDLDTAQKISSKFIEVLIAPHISEDVQRVLQAKSRLKILCPRPTTSALQARSLFDGSLLLQERLHPTTADALHDWDQVSCKTLRASPEELADLLFAWRTVKHVKSNAIVLAHNLQTLGIGAGQMSRVDALRFALQKAADQKIPVHSGVLASDAFFSFQ